MYFVNKLVKSWEEHLSNEFEKRYMQDIQSFLKEQIEIGKIIYPKSENIFNALNSTPLDEVRVVIIGQDPYH
jgi:uracil-DNA glycosylase